MRTFIIFLLIAAPCAAQSVDISASYEPNQNVYRTSTIVGFPIGYKHFSVMPYGAWETWADWNGVVKGRPFRDTYSLGVRIELYSVYADIMHYCKHNVSSYQVDGKDVQDRRSIDYRAWDSTMTLITVGFKKSVTWRPFE